MILPQWMTLMLSMKTQPFQEVLDLVMILIVMITTLTQILLLLLPPLEKGEPRVLAMLARLDRD